jgi:hypothetical protein
VLELARVHVVVVYVSVQSAVEGRREIPGSFTRVGPHSFFPFPFFLHFFVLPRIWTKLILNKIYEFVTMLYNAIIGFWTLSNVLFLFINVSETRLYVRLQAEAY